MEVKTVQFNINTKSNSISAEEKRPVKPYLEAEGAVPTDGLVKPLPGKGHLIHDTILTGPKYFFKDIAYDMKSVKNAYQGKVNDHQAGRLNDVGLQLGGVGIATYLASQTPNPKARLMEYVGLITFLTSMSIFPKIAINTPAKLIHGYDIGKWYIDDQGRKKSVNQDSNYRPMDLYRGEAKGEDIDEIADKMGIPKNIKNRNALTAEQTRKLSTQNNTLWMLAAGFATPIMTALICCGLENYVITPQIEKTRNNKGNKQIAETLEKTKNMQLEIDKINANNFSNKVEALLNSLKGKELAQEDINKILDLLTENIDNHTSTGIKTDVEKIIRTSGGAESVVVDNEAVEKMIEAAKAIISKRQKAKIEPILVPTKEEINSIIKSITSENTTSIENLPKIKEAVKNLITSKINKAEGIPVQFLEGKRNDIIDVISKSIKTRKSVKLDDAGIEKIVNFAKVLGEFKEYRNILDKCKSFKFEETQDTVLANSYNKFEKAMLKELGISYKELKKMKDSEAYTQKILEEKIPALCENETRYKKAFEKFAKIVSEMEVNLNGSNEEKSHILDLINAVENNYNNTAKRLANLDMQGFKTTIKSLVNQDVNTLGNSISTREQLFDLLDGIVENKYRAFSTDNNWNNSNEAQRKDYVRYHYEGTGSSKNQEITRIIERYQGVKNSFNRFLHTLETYKLTLDPQKFIETLKDIDKKYSEELTDQATECVIKDFNLKISPEEFKKLFNEKLAELTQKYKQTKGLDEIKDMARFEIANRYKSSPYSNIDSLNSYFHTKFNEMHTSLSRMDQDYIMELIKKGREVFLTATSSNHNLKLNLVNNQLFYRDIMTAYWMTEAGRFWSTKQKGYASNEVKEAMDKFNNIQAGNVLDRYQYYITRFRNIVANGFIDFTKPFHILNPYIRNNYTPGSKTRMAFFNLVAQTPVDMVKGAAERNYKTQKWVRTVSAITGGVFLATLLAQFGFGKIRNPHNIEKQVKNETN